MVKIHRRVLSGEACVAIIAACFLFSLVFMGIQSHKRMKDITRTDITQEATTPEELVSNES